MPQTDPKGLYKRMQNLQQEPHRSPAEMGSLKVGFGKKHPNSLFSEAFEDTQWVLWLLARPGYASEEQIQFRTYVKYRIRMMEGDAGVHQPTDDDSDDDEADTKTAKQATQPSPNLLPTSPRGSSSCNQEDATVENPGTVNNEVGEDGQYPCQHHVFEHLIATITGQYVRDEITESAMLVMLKEIKMNVMNMKK